MSNINDNRVDTIMKDDSFYSFLKAITSAKNYLPEQGNITIADDDRSNYMSMDVDNRILTENVISELGLTGEGVVPPFISAERIRNDYTLTGQLDALESAALDLLNRIADLRRIAAHEAVSAANTVYGIYQVAAKVGVPGAKEGFTRLSVRYANKGAGAPKIATDEV